MQDSTKTKTNIKSIIFALSFLALLIFIVIAGINFWGQYRAEREYVNKQLALLNQKQEEISDLEQKLDRAQKDMQIVLDKKSAETQSQSPDTSQVKDAYFLVRLADDRLQYANDIQAAKQLLELAQDRIATLNTPEITNVKAILMADQAKLNTLNYPDVKETHEKLAVLDELINSMPLKPTANTEQANNKAAEQKTKENSQSMRFDKEWKRTLNLMLEDLKTLVKVRKKSDSDLDLSYVNVEISKAQFKLLIEQIRWAIFYRDAVVYQRSVKGAQELLSQVFDVNNENVIKFSKNLNELANVQIQPSVPSIKDAVNALQALLVR